MPKPPVALITGGARRIGACCTRTLHKLGFCVIIHYRHSKDAAEQLALECNAIRPDSAIVLTADLNKLEQLEALAKQATEYWGYLDALINNASSFYPTPIESASENDWDDLLGSNVKAPFFLAQALAPSLKKQQGAIVNLADIHAERPLKEHTIYCIAKAGNVMLTKSLAKELAPFVRVNGVAPGAILWPENDTALSDTTKQCIIEKTALKKSGSPANIADTVAFLLQKDSYITGQVITVDGGRTL